MAKITLNPISGSYASVTALNERFSQIELALNNSILWRDDFSGEPNAMEGDLDMNGHNVLNVLSFDSQDLYLGAYPNPPAVNGAGDPLDADDAGALYLNTTLNVVYVWTGTSWVLIGTAQNSAGSVNISDLGGYYVGTTVEEALQELFDGTSDNATKSGTESLSNKTLPLATLTSPVINASISGTAVLDEDDFASNSDTQIATQQSIKAYVDSRNVVPSDPVQMFLDNTASDSGSWQTLDMSAIYPAAAAAGAKSARLRCYVQATNGVTGTNRYAAIFIRSVGSARGLLASQMACQAYFDSTEPADIIEADVGSFVVPLDVNSDFEYYIYVGTGMGITSAQIWLEAYEIE